VSKLIKKSRPGGIGLTSWLLLVFLPLWPSSRPLVKVKEAVKTVVIDAGHGGHDSGCLGKSGVKEKDVALGIALKLGRMIEDQFPGVKVIYTRKTDVFLELHERAEIANTAHADLFICVHCNSACFFDKKKHKEQCNEESKGAESWVMGLHKSEANLEVAKRENNVLYLEKDYERQYEGFDPNSPEADIIFSLYQNTFMDQSLRMATLVQQELANKGREVRGVKQAGFWVLYKTAMPSVLIETGFLSNSSEERYLGSEGGQQEIAMGIYKAFKKYRGSFDQVSESKDRNDSESPVSPSEDVPVKSVARPTIEKVDSVITIPGVNEIWFSVQVLSSVKSLKKEDARLKGLKDVREERVETTYKYFAGKYTSFEEAVAAQSKLRNGKFKDAFVVAYRNQNRITVPEAREAAQKNSIK
jgi:N-acetylmuramoyl-L-alanine amidase